MSKWVEIREKIKSGIKNAAVKGYEKAKELLYQVWTGSKSTINKELARIAVQAVKNVAENRKDLIGKDDERRHAAQDEFKKLLKENSKLAEQDIKDSVMNTLLEIAVIEIKF